MSPKGDISRPDGTTINPDDHPAWDWSRNRPLPGTESPYPVEYSISPTGEIKRPDGTTIIPEDFPSWDWSRNRPIPGIDGPSPVDYDIGPNGEISRPDGSVINPDDYPAWDWIRNRPIPGVDSPDNATSDKDEDEPAFDFDNESPDEPDEPAMDWLRQPRSVPPEEEGPGPVDVPENPAFENDREMPQDGNETPGWDWNRVAPNPTRDLAPPPEEPAFEFDTSKPDEETQPESAWDWKRNPAGPPPPGENPAFDFENDKPDESYGPPGPDVENPAFDFENDKPEDGLDAPDSPENRAPWSMTPDDDTDDGKGPKPMNVPEDLYSEPTEEEKEKPKGTVVPVWMMLTLAVVASVLGAGSATPPGTPAVPPPGLTMGPNPPTSPSTLPNLPTAPAVPCAQDAGCAYIMGAIGPVLPPQTRALINVPGTCQNWAREWLRTGKDIMEFQVERIRQRFSMALIYCEFNGDNWLEGELWVSDLHECDWYTMIGVDPCGRHEQYQILRNYGQQMRGTLPPEISMMSSLWEITFSDNLLTGTIPSEFKKLTELDTFSLSFNLFKGEIPDFMWEFEDMIHLDLAYNFFTGTIPDTVHLTEPNLRDLFVENNDLEGPIPSTFGQIDWQRLHLDGNNFEGSIPQDINAGKMRELMLHNNKLTGEFPASSFANEYTGRRSKLEKVTLYNNNIRGDVNEMCKLKDDPSIGKLEYFAVDKDKVACDCCSGPP